MKVLYIGQFQQGSTSKMRGEQIRKILNPDVFCVVDTSIPFNHTHKFFRSFGFRYKSGPLISEINNYIWSEINLKGINSDFDLIWVDKGVFLKESLIKFLRAISKKLVHFTPDMAFYENKSNLFLNSIRYYDFLITTKTIEFKTYEKYVPQDKIIITTQGFSKELHYPTTSFNLKENSVVFIGLAEKSRFKVAEILLENNINLKVAGMGWDTFSRKYSNYSNFKYYGNGIFGEQYSNFLSSSIFGLGLLSKRFPEYHTTRTFEIPACGTALLTEKNVETEKFFSENEAIFYNDFDELVEKIKYYSIHIDKLKAITEEGNKSVHLKGFDYGSILKRILDKVFL